VVLLEREYRKFPILGDKHLGCNSMIMPRHLNLKKHLVLIIGVFCLN